MALLTVIIPALGEPENVETTLVSVLQNRPANCQVIVARSASYVDRYELDDEVEFINVQGDDTSLTWMAMVNAAMPNVQSPVVNVLKAGVEIPPAWFAAPLKILKDNPNVGMVSPLVRTAQGESWHGVRFESNEGRVVITSGGKQTAIGPTEQAGFFRTETVTEVGGWDQDVSPSLADIELALAAGEQDWQCEMTAKSMAWVPQGTPTSTATEKRLRTDVKKLQRRYRRQIAELSETSQGGFSQLVGMIFGSLTHSAKSTARKHFIPSTRLSPEEHTKAA